MTPKTRFLRGSGALVIWLACLGGGGCQHANHHLAARRSGSPLGGEPNGQKLTEHQVADVQVALGRSFETQGEVAQAMAAYQEALKHDRRRADACRRLAILHDQQGKFKEAAEWYQKALHAEPRNPEIYCDTGYSLYLQQRWDEAEKNLRQAVALKSDLARAHNNLGLLLAHTERPSEAITEFLKAGCSEADAHVNLAFCLTLDRQWDDARANYVAALAANPSSQAATSGLQELELVMAKTGPVSTSTPADAVSTGNAAKNILFGPIGRSSPADDAQVKPAGMEIIRGDQHF